MWVFFLYPCVDAHFIEGCKMSVGVLVNGFSGKMGQVALQAIEDNDGLHLAGQTRRGDDLQLAIQDTKPDVVLDLTVASVVYENAVCIIESGVCPVIGTSGLVADQVKALQALCKDRGLGGLVVPNFSISAVLMMKYAQDAMRYLNHAEIVEMHHNKKEDAPSGTAIRTAEMMREAMPDTRGQSVGQETIEGARGAQYQDIHIHSVRLPGLVAHQEVILGGDGQTLTIRSDTLNREAFMSGISLACQRVGGLSMLCYGLEHVLGPSD